MSEFKLNVDHVVVVVSDLAHAIEQFQSLGFTLSPGGDNGPTHNALIPFEDGSYIELISIRSKLLRGIFSFLYQTSLICVLKPFTSQLSFRLLCWMGGPTGIRDWCIKHQRLDELVVALSADNIRMTKIEKFTRTKPNLEKVEWLLVAPVEKRLPFFIQDLTATEVRIPRGGSAHHNNGCKGITGLVLDEGIYSSVAAPLEVLHQQETASNHDSEKIKIKIALEQTSRISVELVLAESTAMVLEMKKNEGPRLMNLQGK